MKKMMLTLLARFIPIVLAAQPGMPAVDRGTPVYQDEDVVFYKVDEHTWAGNGHMMANESLYILEGENSAILIDAGTKITDLDKIVASITSKPVKLVATHVHPDHTGSSINYFSEIYLHEADTVNIRRMMSDYKGKINYLNDGDVIELGGRKISVVHLPGHTPGSIAFLDYDKSYGFSGDAFGSGNLLLGTDFSTLKATCEKMKKIMAENDVSKMYPGHFNGANFETPARIDNMLKVCNDILSGEINGEKSGQPNLLNPSGESYIITGEGFRINYTSDMIK
jgi:glyoxylase-like metal-dependent hydrolase (beta-lactamase superfamily II)